ncbi:MAG: hypothetical protein HY536_00540 [Candidatus Colwellbacteria bacterium]|nr:hypothetical protein [Candidatus Colwellbacteria bacterium]
MAQNRENPALGGLSLIISPIFRLHGPVIHIIKFIERQKTPRAGRR